MEPNLARRAGPDMKDRKLYLQESESKMRSAISDDSQSQSLSVAPLSKPWYKKHQDLITKNKLANVYRSLALLDQQRESPYVDKKKNFELRHQRALSKQH